LAQVLERHTDTPIAIKFYWETIKIEPIHKCAKEAHAKIVSIAAREKTRRQVDEILQGKPQSNIFLLAEAPGSGVLARYFVALSNATGGVVVIGIDPRTRRHSGATINDDFVETVRSVWLDCCTAPCLFDVVDCSSPS